MGSQCQSLFNTDFQKTGDYVPPSDLAFSENQEDQTLGVLISQIDFIRKLSSVNTPESFNKQILSMLSGFGFTDYALICKTELNSIDSPHSSLPKELFEEYEKGRYCRFDMVLDYINSGRTSPILLSMVEQVIESAPLMTYTFEKNLQILELYKQFKIDNAYVVPVRSKRGSGYETGVFSVMAIGADRERFLALVKRYEPLLKVLADAVSFISETKFSPGRQEDAIKPKPLRLLNAMATQDLSLSEAAENLCISLDTANKHMALAKQALGTSSQANAVYLAIKKGLISV